MNCNNAISQIKNDVLIKIHVIPNSNTSIFPSKYNKWRKCIEIKLKAQAKENKANNEIIEKISKYFNFSPKNVIITSGQKNREKTVLLKNIKAEDVIKKIEDSLNGL